MKSANHRLQPDISKLIVETDLLTLVLKNNIFSRSNINVSWDPLGYALFVSVCVCVFSRVESDWRRNGLGFDYAQECKSFKAVCWSRKKANSTVGKIKIKIINRIKDTILRLCKCIVWRQLKYYNRGSHCKKPDMEKLKKVHATKS